MHRRTLPILLVLLACGALVMATKPLWVGYVGRGAGVAVVCAAIALVVVCWWRLASNTQLISRKAREEAAARLASSNAAAGQARAEQAALRAVIDAVPSPILATDRAGVVTLCNRAALEFFEGRPAVVGRRLDHLFTQSEVIATHARALATGAAETQVRLLAPGGVRICEVFVGADSAGAVLTLRDITQLATAVQLKTDFVANASHELRTPLTSIRGAVETLTDGAWDDPGMRRRLTGMIGENVLRLEEMVRDLLDLSRLESPEAAISIEDVRVEGVLAQLRETFEPLARERRVALEFAGAGTLRTDAKLLHLILKNLVDNAVKFAYADTTVRVAAAVAPGGASFTVADRGIGIPLSHQPRIFERFYQADASRAGAVARRGTGLGLAIVKHAVKTLGGTISVESVWKEGTTVTVELPAATGG